MEVINGIPAAGFYIPNAALSIGVFDGLHQGHRELLNQVVEFSRRHELKSLVLTFSVSPAMLMSRHIQPEFLTTEREKAQILAQLGIDWMWSFPFDEQIRNMTYLEFWKDRIDRYMHVAAYFCGDEHAFGRDKGGDVTTLTDLSRREEFQIFPIHVVQDHQLKISSSHIRQLIKDGYIDEANQRLGYAYPLRGRVVTGDGLGRKLGFPTANLTPETNKLIPAPGVYAGQAAVRHAVYSCLIYIGRRPSIPHREMPGPVRIESYLLDFDQDIYGEELDLQFFRKIRDDKFFNTIDALRHQINHDVSVCRQQPIGYHEMPH
ncbi:MAG: riboflavin biosynthesis protein RibF [Candidatus Delongbacteria bacterium]|nr:riboflavin biosynthesis protein RibF [Candidatus Delongbacteria bacterium]